MSNNSKPFSLTQQITAFVGHTTYGRRKKRKQDRIKPATHKVGTTKGIQLGPQGTQSGTHRTKGY
jgi:hypothetical protein